MLVSSLVIFPVLFVAPYALLIGRMAKQAVDTITVPVQGLGNAPGLIAYLAEEQDIQTVEAGNVEELVRNKEYPTGLIIPDDYETKLAAGETVSLVLVVDLRRSLDVTVTRLSGAIAEYGQAILAERLKERSLADEFVIPLEVERRNAATTTETAGSMLGLFVPGAIISIGLTAGMPVAVSVIAGEKKKLTLEPVLFTTVNRFQLVFAKLLAVLAIVIFNLVTTAVSMGMSALIAIMVLIRMVPEGLFAASETGTPSTTSEMLNGGYNIQPLALILFLLAPGLIVLFGAALQLLLSTWARNDEEASAYLTPLSLFSGLIMFVAFFLDEYVPKLWHYALPVFGTILSMRDLLGDKIDPPSLAVMFVSSLLYALLMLGLAVWMFHQEEVVFRT
jgi:sodium transport system permease protein